MKTKRIAYVGILAAMCAVLGYLAIDIQIIKFTLESFPVIFAAYVFGPGNGMLVGLIGTTIYQLLKYGVSATTLLWILPYVICGLLVGLYCKAKDFKCTKGQSVFLAIAGELIIMILNTPVMYLDSKMYGYYFEGYISVNLPYRFLLALAKGIVFGLFIPALSKSINAKSLRK